MRLLFMGTPEFAVPALQALLDSAHTVCAVYTQPPRPAGRGQRERRSPVHALAAAQAIPVHTPTGLKSSEVQAEIAAYTADVIVVAAYGLLLPTAVLQSARDGCFNIHPSLLPRWRGAAPIPRQIMAGDRETGVCIMQMEEGLDSGPVLLRERMPMPEGVTAGQLHDLLAAKGAALLLQALDRPDRLEPQPQPSDGVTYAHKISRTDAPLDWSRPALELERQVRGLNPWPGATFTYQDQPIKVLAAEVISLPYSITSGTVLDNRLTVACGAEALRLLTLQRPGKQAMPSDALLRGFPIEKGTILR